MGTNSSSPGRYYAIAPTVPGTGEFPYRSPAAFRAALKARFAAITKQDPRYTVNELQRQFAYDRILSRCFAAEDAVRWVLKGAGALLARLPDGRHSKDIDLYYTEFAAGTEEATAALRAARWTATSGTTSALRSPRPPHCRKERRVVGSICRPIWAGCTRPSTSTWWSAAP